MKQKIKGFKGLLSIVLCLVLIAQGVSVENISAATKVKINKTKASIYVGKTVQLKVTGTKKKVTWKSSNKKVATVTSKGKVKGVKKGTTKITATVSKKKYVCKVTVKNKAVKVTPTPKPTKTVSPTVKPTPTPTIKPIKTPTLPPPTPTPPVGSVIIPTQTPIVTPGAIEYCNVGESYISKNGLNVCVNSVTSKAIGSNAYSCTINYSIENNTDELINEPSFRVFDAEGNVYDQYGSFGYIYPSGYKKNVSYTFTITEKIKPTILELQTDQIETFTNYKDILNPNELHWIVP